MNYFHFVTFSPGSVHTTNFIIKCFIIQKFPHNPSRQRVCVCGNFGHKHFSVDDEQWLVEEGETNKEVDVYALAELQST